MSVKRIGQLIKLKPNAYEAYKKLHAEVWDEVLTMIYKANIRNFSIFHWGDFLFAYMEYIGDDFESDMASIAQDPITREWWQVTDPLQEPVEGNSIGSIDGNWWKDMELLFHTD